MGFRLSLETKRNLAYRKGYDTGWNGLDLTSNYVHGSVEREACDMGFEDGVADRKDCEDLDGK